MGSPVPTYRPGQPVTFWEFVHEYEYVSRGRRATALRRTGRWVRARGRVGTVFSDMLFVWVTVVGDPEDPEEWEEEVIVSCQYQTPAGRYLTEEAYRAMKAACRNRPDRFSSPGLVVY